MKKRLIIIAITVVKFLITGSAQVASKTETVNKQYINNQYRCLVRIKTITGDEIEAALSCLKANSIRVTLVEADHVRAGGKYIKILRENPDTAITVDQLREFSIKYDPNIIRSDELIPRKKQLRNKNAGKIVGLALWPVAIVGLAAASTLSGTPIDPIPIPGTSHGSHHDVTVSGDNLRVTKSYKTFTINGDNEHYIKMVKRLIKSNRNPFESNVSKN